jgi:FKBP-type peptidyl-prolyl cis-trans isomerase FkpA
MESITILGRTARRAVYTLSLLTPIALAACSQPRTVAPSSPAANPQPLATDIERTTFSPSLGVHLDSMNRHADGLYVQDLIAGTGAVGTRGRTVLVQYTGWLANGKQFDAGEITVTLGTFKTIRAWEEGLLGMRVGGKRRLVVPSSLAYGAKGAGDAIPPNAVLVFEMEMKSVL